jgi:hypothetical protein
LLFFSIKTFNKVRQEKYPDKNTNFLAEIDPMPFESLKLPVFSPLLKTDHLVDSGYSHPQLILNTRKTVCLFDFLQDCKPTNVSEKTLILDPDKLSWQPQK